MNKKGFISISVVYSFFLVFIAIVLSIIAAYYSRRLMLLEVKKDIRNVIDEHTSYDCFSKGITKLNECIIDTYGGEDEIKEQEEPNFAVSTNANESGLYFMEDDLGDSYYFRGDVKNNYVKFAQNDEGIDMYWRILRINGDGTIRLVYDGTLLVENGTEHAVSVGVVDYATDPASLNYVNYTDSLIKSYLDDWYLNNLYDYYNDYMYDSIFCNDRSVYLKTYFTTSNSFVITNSVTNYYTVDFASQKRILIDKTPSLKCENINDRLTVENLSLTYPVGLLTADEVMISGVINSNAIQKNYYLYSGESAWTMTPHDDEVRISGYDADMWYLEANGAIKNTDGIVNAALGVRPVINIRSDIKIKKGNGRIDNPYILEEVNY